MCWSEEVSFMTAMMSTTIAIYIYKRDLEDDVWCAGQLMVIAAMQYIEFVGWLVVKSKNNDYIRLNKFLARICIPLLLAIQPYTAFIGAFRNGYITNPFWNYYHIVYGCVVFVYLFIKRKPNDLMSDMTNPRKNMFNEGHYLDWGHLEIPLAISLHHTACIMGPFLTQVHKPFVQQMIITGALTKWVFARSASRWCLYTNGWSIIYLFNH